MCHDDAVYKFTFYLLTYLLTEVGDVCAVMLVVVYCTPDVDGASVLGILDVCLDPIDCRRPINVSDPENCLGYFVCSGSELYPRSCSPGETFHQNVLLCVTTHPSCAGQCVDESYKKHIIISTNTTSRPVAIETSEVTRSTERLVRSSAAGSGPIGEGTTIATPSTSPSTLAPLHQTSSAGRKLSPTTTVLPSWNYSSTTVGSSAGEQPSLTATTRVGVLVANASSSDSHQQLTSAKVAVDMTTTTPNDVNVTVAAGSGLSALTSLRQTSVERNVSPTTTVPSSSSYSSTSARSLAVAMTTTTPNDVNVTVAAGSGLSALTSLRQTSFDSNISPTTTVPPSSSYSSTSAMRGQSSVASAIAPVDRLVTNTSSNDSRQLTSASVPVTSASVVMTTTTPNGVNVTSPATATESGLTRSGYSRSLLASIITGSLALSAADDAPRRTTSVSSTSSVTRASVSQVAASITAVTEQRQTVSSESSGKTTATTSGE